MTVVFTTTKIFIALDSLFMVLSTSSPADFNIPQINHFHHIFNHSIPEQKHKHSERRLQGVSGLVQKKTLKEIYIAHLKEEWSVLD
jgi:hypothetical protein